ncbi:unnamed protein product [Trichogramma brassicae]|uniref:Uncharacterized protein n=1 Tax=Trichogramma brassicae TaxID=86971 RepID=A0A6H5I2F5_9HYME|nr:unnamed protein product [Trichogramma brassicae]
MTLTVNRTIRARRYIQKILDPDKSCITQPEVSRRPQKMKLLLFRKVTMTVKNTEVQNIVCMPNEFSYSDYDHIREYLLWNEPLAKLIDKLQGEDNMYYGYVLPGLLNLRLKWKNLLQGSADTGCKTFLDGASGCCLTVPRSCWLRLVQVVPSCWWLRIVLSVPRSCWCRLVLPIARSCLLTLVTKLGYCQWLPIPVAWGLVEVHALAADSSRLDLVEVLEPAADSSRVEPGGSACTCC